jgi:putative FmdB family regulatory protein
MPTYDYFCTNCSYQEEVIQKMTDSSLIECRQCKKPTLKRGPGGGIGLQFLGTGFYLTDYPSSSEKPSTPCCPCEKSTCSNSSLKD